MRITMSHLKNGAPGDGEMLLPDPQVAKRYSVSAMSIWRWDHRPELGFPKPIRIQGRKYRRLSELREWEKNQRLGRR